MHPTRKKRLIILSGILLSAGLVIGLVLFALKQNINLFYSPSQIANQEAPVGKKIRAGGMVVDGSVNKSKTDLQVKFAVTDYKNTLWIEYNGILPDLFREGQGIIAQGRLNDNHVLIADEVLAKHDENYMPPEVAEALKAQHKNNRY